MKTITGKQAAELIEGAEAVIIQDNNYALTYPSIEYNDDLINIDCNYADEEGLTYEYSFKIWEDDQIIIDDNQLMLPDSDNEGALVGLKLLIEQIL